MMIDNIIEVVKETETAINLKAEAAIMTIVAEEATKVFLGQFRICAKRKRRQPRKRWRSRWV